MKGEGVKWSEEGEGEYVIRGGVRSEEERG